MEKTAQQRYLEAVVAVAPCSCGCGGEVEIKRYATMPSYRRKRKLDGWFLPGHLPAAVRESALAAACATNREAVGRQSNHWEGGTIEQGGYRFVRVGKRYVQEHRLVAGTPDDHVTHHANLDKLDNAPDNLQPMPRTEHAALHYRMRAAAGSCAKIIRKVDDG